VRIAYSSDDRKRSFIYANSLIKNSLFKICVEAVALYILIWLVYIKSIRIFALTIVDIRKIYEVNIE
jgi:hypothetical protein